MTVKAFILAMTIFGQQSNLPVERMEVAGEAIWRIASEMNVDPLLVASIGWVETRWNPKIKSRTSDCGILQVNLRYTKFTCKQLQNIEIGVREGITKLKIWKARFSKKESRKKAWVCHYNGGNRCYTRAKRYARKVYRVFVRLKKLSSVKYSGYQRGEAANGI